MKKEEMEKYTTLDIEQCKWWVNHLFNIAKEQAFNSNLLDDAKEIQSAQDKIIKVLEQESGEDAISRKAVIDMAYDMSEIDGEHFTEPCMVVKVEDIKKLPSVTPTQKTKAEIIDDLIKEIEDAEKKFDDKGAHHVSAGFYYARKELEKMKGAE